MTSDDDFNEALEAAYWHFDSLVKGHNADRMRAGLGPMEERMAFKSAVRSFCASSQRLTGEEREALAWARDELRTFHRPYPTSEDEKYRAADAVLDRLLASTEGK